MLHISLHSISRYAELAFEQRTVWLVTRLAAFNLQIDATLEGTVGSHSPIVVITFTEPDPL